MSTRATVQQKHVADITDVAGHDQMGIRGPPNTGACSPLATNPMPGPKFMDQLIPKIMEAMARLEKACPCSGVERNAR